MDGQVSWLGTVHPLLTLSFFSTWILPLHVVSCCVFNDEEEVVVIRNGWTPKKEDIKHYSNVRNIKKIHSYTEVLTKAKFQDTENFMVRRQQIMFC